MRAVRGRSKRCTKCGQIKRLAEFRYNAKTTDKLNTWCTPCLCTPAGVYQDQYRALVFDHYGNKCACCGSTETLVLDHVRGNGSAHREGLSITGIPGCSSAFYYWLVTNEFPAECEPEGEYALQSLCKSCSKAGIDHCRIHCTETGHGHSVTRGPKTRTTPCLHCGGNILQIGRGRPRKFCSASHRVMYCRAVQQENQLEHTELPA
jgi:hypothetical protein